MPYEVLACPKNPEGRVVEIRRHTWDHVVARHPELSDMLETVIEAIEYPDHRELDPLPGRLRYVYRLGRRGALRVVTEFAGEKDVMVTAFLDTRPPR